MEISGLVLIGLMVVAIFISTPLLGRYFAKVYGGEAAPGDRFFNPIERIVYRMLRVDPEREQKWSGYSIAVLAFSAFGIVLLYAQLRLQEYLPFNPTGALGMTPALAWNTAVSFNTNTNWQNYAGEGAAAHLTQMAGLAVHNFTSAAVGLAVVIALIRGLTRKGSPTIGNFWVDLTRSITRVLLPLAVVLAVVLMSQGVVQNLHGFTTATTVDQSVTVTNADGTTTAVTQQSIPGGPIASQEAIKELGTNGGGPYNANSSHPFENPTAFSDFLEIWSLLAIPFALAYAFGLLAGDKKQGRIVFGVMFTVWMAATLVAVGMESSGNPRLTAVGVDQSVTATQPGGNFEGKEVRFGPTASGLFAASTTGTSTGSVNSQHDSMTALGGGVVLLHMLLGEVSPGGVGVGLNGLLILALLSVFIAGLMVGRTPEFLGKKIQAAEMKLVVVYILVMPIVALTFAAASVLLRTAVASTANPGAHGLSEILYAFGSASNNNGSAFGGLNGNTQWYNTTLGIAMLLGRYFLIIPTLAIAGTLGRKKPVPVTAGTFPTNTPLFGGLVIGVTLIVAGLTFFPALALGPIVEHLSL
jgi:K+-transporting ATPase ATPase A chain